MSAPGLAAGGEWGLGLGEVLWRVTWQGALWALVVGALLRAVPRLPASLRTTLWWLVGLKCLVGLCTPGLVRLPLLPASTSVGFLVRAPPGRAPLPAADSGREGRPAGEGVSGVEPGALVDGHCLGWGALLLVWLGGVAWQGRTLGRGLVQVRRLRREARELEEPALQEAAGVLARRLGLSRPPRVRVSSLAPSPLALGLLRPEILLPRRALETLSARELRMALAHELAHVRRGDLWLGWVPALARVLFFFHPLVVRACREYALAREEACDAAALLATEVSPHEYGRLLLVFGVTRAPAAAAAPGASSHLAALKRRIAMLEHVRIQAQSTPRWARWTLGVLALGALVPFQVVAREASAPPRVAALEPVPPSAPGAPAAPAAPVRVGRDDRNEEDSDEERFSYVLVHSADSTVMSGSTRDLREALTLWGNGKQPLLYLHRDGKKYVIRSPEVLKAVGEAARIDEQLGKEQSELGEKQAELAVKQSALGEKQAEIGMKLGTLGRKHAELSLAMARLDRGEGRASPESEHQREQLEQDQKALDRQERELDGQMEGFGEQMEGYGREMEQLGRQMEQRGRQMEQRGRGAERKVQSLLEDAVRKGLAEPVKP